MNYWVLKTHCDIIHLHVITLMSSLLAVTVDRTNGLVVTSRLWLVYR